MKILRLLILCLLSIFCLNSCLATAAIIGSMQGEGLLPPPKPKYLFLENIEDFPQIFLNKKVKVKIEGTNKEIYIPEGFELIEYDKIKRKYDDRFPKFYGSIYLGIGDPEFIIYNKKGNFALTLGINKNRKIEDIADNFEDLKKLKENTYLAKAKKGYGDAFLKQIDNQILVYSVVSSGSILTDEKNQERIKIYLELTKDW